MIKLQFFADSIEELRNDLARTLSSLPTVPPPGYGISALGLNAVNPAAEAHWEAARQLGFRQGFERGLAEGRPRPADYPPSAPEVANQTTPGPWYPPPAAEYGPERMAGGAQQAELNRKIAADVAQQRAQAYPVPGTGDGPEQPMGYASSPENVARALKAKHHDHIGMTD